MYLSLLATNVESRGLVAQESDQVLPRALRLTQSPSPSPQAFCSLLRTAAVLISYVYSAPRFDAGGGCLSNTGGAE